MSKLSSFIRNPRQHPLFHWISGSKDGAQHRLPSGVGTERGLEAIGEACRRLGLQVSSEDEPVIRPFSIGSVVSDRNGRRYWLRVSGHRNSSTGTAGHRMLRMPAVPGVPMPSILNATEWTGHNMHWLAVQMALAPSPPVEQTSYARENAGTLSDRWIASLKNALDHLAACDVTADRCMTPESIRNQIVRRWGPAAPHSADDWRLAHGDLQWSNVTAPELMILDWGGWGLAPRGYDAAKLVMSAFHQPDLARRLEQAFVGDLESGSGKVAMLAAAAQRLEKIEKKRGTKKYVAWIEERAARIIPPS